MANIGLHAKLKPLRYHHHHRRRQNQYRHNYDCYHSYHSVRLLSVGGYCATNC